MLRTSPSRSIVLIALAAVAGMVSMGNTVMACSVVEPVKAETSRSCCAKRPPVSPCGCCGRSLQAMDLNATVSSSLVVAGPQDQATHGASSSCECRLDQPGAPSRDSASNITSSPRERSIEVDADLAISFLAAPRPTTDGLSIAKTSPSWCMPLYLRTSRLLI